MRLLVAWREYIGSSFTGYGDSLGKLEETLKVLNTLKLMQLSLDTPNINQKLLDCLLAAVVFTCFMVSAMLDKSVLTGSQRNLSRIASEFSKNHLLDMLTNFWLMICMNCMREEAKIFQLKLCEHHWFENFRTIVRIIEI